MRRLVVEGQLVDPDFDVQWGQVSIKDGEIEAVGDLGYPADLKLSKEELIFPGFVDVHVHLRQGEEYKEDYQTAAQAALQGGVTAMLDMPNNPVPPRAVEDLALKRSLVKDLPVDVDFYLGIGPGTRPSPGHRFYKAFMGPSIGPLYFEDDDQLEEALQHYKGQRVTLHCEDPQMLRDFKGAPTHEEQRPPQAEVKAIATALRLADKYGFKIHVAHLTTPEGLQLLEGRSDVAVWEATPHHLYFDTTNREEMERDEFLKMNPPLRSPQQRKLMLAAFLAGRIPLLSTDHAPHTVEEKSTTNPSGVPLLDTHGGFISWLMAQGFTPAQVARHCCQLPGELMNPGRLGRLAKGYRGHLAVLAPNWEWTVHEDDIRSKCAWSPFEGETFPGHVTYTVASGRLFRDGLEIT